MGRSTDPGESWTTFPITGIDANPIMEMLLGPDGRLYCARHKGVFRLRKP